jgi:hypothetical protein
VIALAALPALSVRGRARTEVPENWALIPSGFEVGDSFRPVATAARRPCPRHTTPRWSAAAGGLEAHLEYEQADSWPLDVRDGKNPDPRPRSGSPALRRAGKAAGDAACIGAFGGENWLEGRTPTFGPDPDCDTGKADAGEDRQ